MSGATYFFVQPFRPGRRSRKGRDGLMPGEAREVRSAGEAIRSAERAVASGGAALVFARKGDPDTGDFDDAVILGSFGPVPPEAFDS